MKFSKMSLALGTLLVSAVLIAGTVSCKGDGLLVDADGNPIDLSWQDEIPSDKTILAVDLSGSFSIKDGGTSSIEDWEAVAVYSYSAELFGGWPGKLLDQTTESNDKIFYAEISDSETGSGTFIINNNGSGIQTNDIGGVTIEKGKRYLLRGTSCSTF